MKSLIPAFACAAILSHGASAQVYAPHTRPHDPQGPAPIINPPSYRLIELPTLGGDTGFATEISNYGWVVGGSTNAAGLLRPFRWRVGFIENLGTLGTMPHAAATSVNDSGDVAGVASETPALGGPTAQPWVRRDGVLVDLDPFDRNLGAAALGINNARTVVGWLSIEGAGSVDAVSWSNANVSPIPMPPGDTCGISYGTDISDAGDAVGFAAPPGFCGNTLAWLRRAGITQFLPTLGGPNGRAEAISPYGDVVGRSDTLANGSHATIWSWGQTIRLNSPAPSSAALDINSWQVVVGQMFPGGSRAEAVVWIDRTPFRLADLIIGGHALDAATAINDFGVIVGYGLNAAGQTRAYVLLPTCIGDFNEDGGVDGLDVASFFERWEAGDPDTDVNGDGGIDGGDVERFFERWQAGRC